MERGYSAGRAGILHQDQPSSRAWRRARLTVVREQPANAALAAIGRTQAPAALTLAGNHGQDRELAHGEAGGDLRRHDPAHGLTTAPLDRGLAVRRSRVASSGGSGEA